jgi:hypothetical protein
LGAGVSAGLCSGVSGNLTDYGRFLLCGLQLLFSACGPRFCFSKPTLKTPVAGPSDDHRHPDQAPTYDGTGPQCTKHDDPDWQINAAGKRP